MLKRSISWWSADPTQKAREASRTRCATCSRCLQVSRFESSIPSTSNPSPNTTAHATTGPHRAPRPTSSSPAIAACPCARASSSKRQPQTSSTPWWTRGRRPRGDPCGCGGTARSLNRGRPLLLHATGLALLVAEVVQLGPPHARLLHDLDLLDGAGVQGEDALHALAEGDLAHGHGGPGPCALEADHDALEDLDTLALGLLGLTLDLLLDRALLDPDVDADGVPGVETGEVLLQVPGLDA